MAFRKSLVRPDRLSINIALFALAARLAYFSCATGGDKHDVQKIVRGGERHQTGIGLPPAAGGQYTQPLSEHER
jgi:hypothetical protein